jgi:hypothetical protein
MEAVNSSETLVFFHSTTRRQYPEALNLIIKTHYPYYKTSVVNFLNTVPRWAGHVARTALKQFLCGVGGIPQIADSSLSASKMQEQCQGTMS